MNLEDWITDSQINELKTVASIFRAAIESCELKNLSIGFETFPYGSCGDATLLLGTYLIEQGFDPFHYVCGEKRNTATDDWHPHAWLQKSNLVVDITADQFPDITDPVIVSNNSSWHRSWRTEIKNIADYRNYDLHTVSELNRSYYQIIKNLKD